jgi:hypothetical protein
MRIDRSRSPRRGLRTVWLFAVAATAAACDAPSPAPPAERARAREVSALWTGDLGAGGPSRERLLGEARALVTHLEASNDGARLVTDPRVAELGAAVLLGRLAGSDTVVSGVVRGVRRSHMPDEGGRRPVIIVSLAVTETLVGLTTGTLEYWAWASPGAAAPREGARIVVGLLSRRGAAETHTLAHPQATFEVGERGLTAPGLQVPLAALSRSLDGLKGGAR